MASDIEQLDMPRGHSSFDETPYRSDACAKVEAATAQMVEAFGTRRLDRVFAEHVDDNFTSIMGYLGGTCRNLTPSEAAAISNKLARENPSWWNAAWNVTSVQDDLTGHITVLASATLHGLFDTLACESAHEMTWIYRKNQWKAVRYRFLTGGGDAKCCSFDRPA